VSRRLAGALAASLALLALAAPAAAQEGVRHTPADWEPSGSIRGFLLWEPGEDERRLGGGTMVDLHQRFGPATVGLAIGIGAITSDNDDVNRIFAPIGATVGIGFLPDPVGVHAYVRAGFWGGATNLGLRGGAWLSGGARFDVALGERIALGVDVEVWRLWGELERFLVSPGLSLVWHMGGPAEPPPPAELPPPPPAP